MFYWFPSSSELPIPCPVQPVLELDGSNIDHRIEIGILEVESTLPSGDKHMNAHCLLFIVRGSREREQVFECVGIVFCPFERGFCGFLVDVSASEGLKIYFSDPLPH